MSTRNMDSSTLTRIRQARALYSYNAARNAAVLAGTSVRPEQGGAGTWASTVVERNLGGPSSTLSQAIVEKGCACADFTVLSAQGYPANVSRD